MTNHPSRDWEEIKELPGNMPWLDIVDWLVERHKDLWQCNHGYFWIARLMEEVGELAAAWAGDHEHPWELEAAQIAAMASNMLRHHAESLSVLRGCEKHS